MSFIARLLRLQPTTAGPILHSTDEVVPMHLFDNQEVMRSYDLFWTFRFEEVLDADMLGKSLSDLIETGDWRKLGGRYRLRSDGKLEVHIPRPFTPERPPIYFTTEHFDISIAEHPLASTFPKAGENAELFRSARDLAPLAYGPGAPKCMDDYLRGDFPMLSLHVVTFMDATLVSVNWNHTMSDLGGFAAILKGWVACLAGKEPPEFKSMEDSMQPLYDNPPRGTPLIADSILSGWRKVTWILRFLWDQFWTTGAFQSHTVCIPMQRMDALLQVCRAEAAEAATITSSDPFISEGDVLMAMAARLAAWSLPAGTSRTVSTLGAVDPRTRIPALFNPDAAYVQNAPCGLLVMQSTSEILTKPVGELALDIRNALAEQAIESQMRLTAAVSAESLRATGSLPVMGDATSYLTVYSNWSKARLLDIVDFGPAVVSSSHRDRTRQSVMGKADRPVFFHSRSLTMGKFTTSMLLVHGRDYNGDMWFGGDSNPYAWDKLIDYINSLE